MILYSLFGFFMVLIVSFLLIYEFKKTKELVTPLTVILGMSLIDIFVPGFLYLTFGISDLPPWIYLTTNDLLLGLLISLIGLVLFIVGYNFVSKINLFNKEKFIISSFKLNIKYAYLLLIISGGMYLLKLNFDINRAGSLSNYISSKLYLRWSADVVEYGSFVEDLVTTLSPTMFWVFITTVGVLFYYRIQYNKKIVWGIILPLIAWLFTITTFYRGTQINFFMGFFVIEMLRFQKSKINPLEVININFKKWNKKIIPILLVGVILFSAYGSIRNYFSFQEHNEYLTGSEAVIFEVKRYFKGSALIGVSSIISYYPQNKEFFYGKTIKDMLLLPVPRAIYPSKPEWYGIDDITTGMNWPSSTQSAVSMQGELYANFGYIGIIFMVIFGAIFGVFYKSRYTSRLMFIYAFTFLPAVFVTFWMSFTGLINGLIRLPVLLIFLWPLIKEKKGEKGFIK